MLLVVCLCMRERSCGWLQCASDECMMLVWLVECMCFVRALSVWILNGMCSIYFVNRGETQIQHESGCWISVE